MTAPHDTEKSGQTNAAGAQTACLGAAAAQVTFNSYRILGLLAQPLVKLYLQRRLAQGREDRLRFGERLGKAGLARPDGPLVLLHAASVGEAVSLLPLVDRLREDWPKLTLLMTSGTVTSAKLMAERLPQGVIHQFAPVDLPRSVDRFLDHWRPSVALMVESEFWPNLIRGTAAAGCELILLNGRISPSSHRRWRRFPPLIASLLGKFSLVTARSAGDKARLCDLGATTVLCLGDLKAAAPRLSADSAALYQLRAAIGERPVWLAASTHRGEEELVARCHQALAPRHPGLLTLLAPRHPARSQEVLGKLQALNLSVARRSLGEPIAAQTDIYLADTLGELGLIYRLAEVVFLGGSLVPTGGHNLLEPAKLQSALLTGPKTTNFSEMAEAMLGAKALRRVLNVSELQDAVSDLLSDPGKRESLAVAAEAYAHSQAGVLDRVVEVLQPALDRASKRM